MTKNEQVSLFMALHKLCESGKLEEVKDVLETSLIMMGVPEGKFSAKKKEDAKENKKEQI